jgi:hypothetical protein
LRLTGIPLFAKTNSNAHIGCLIRWEALLFLRAGVREEAITFAGLAIVTQRTELAFWTLSIRATALTTDTSAVVFGETDEPWDWFA